MKNLLFLLLIILSACKDDEALNVFIENEANRTNNSSQKQSQIPKNKLSNVSLYGTIKNGKGITIRLESPLILDKIALDSILIDESEKFTLNAFIPNDYGYYVLRLLNNSNDSIEIPLRGGDSIELNSSINEFTTKPRLSGVMWSDEANQFLEQKRNHKNDLAKYASKLMKQKPSSPYNIVLSKYFIGSEQDINERKIEIFQDVTMAFIDSFPKSLATKNFVDQLDVLVDIRSKTLNLSKGDYMINNAFYDVPEISLNTPDNKPLNLSSLKGKYVLVDFWASWCGPCRRENPNVVKLYKEYRKKNFTVYSVSLDEDDTKWKQAIKMDNLIWPNHVSDLKGWKSPVVPMFNIQGIPYTVLVNPEGKIIGVNLRGKELENKLKQIFKS